MNENTVTVQSPGRINIIGEHTDYNEGFVLPAAVDKKAIFYLRKNETTATAHITASNMKEVFSFDLTSFQPLSGGWQNYIMGVVHELQKLGAKISGFEGKFEGDVPIGGGMSSSAALECSLAYGLNVLFDLKLDKWQLIKASQMAEHNFVGIQCGIMDQFASMMGKKNQVMLLDCRSLEYQYFPLDLENYEILLLNTKVSHSLATSEYNTRKEECEAGVSLLQELHPETKIQSLRDADFSMLSPFEEKFDSSIFARCKHVVLENNRVLEATQALVRKDFKGLGALMYQSHFSLQNDYQVSCPELDYLVQQTINKDYILGSRMMGGGFGGCTINIIEKNQTTAFIEQATKNYRNHFGIDLSPYLISIENGTEEVK